MAGCTMVAGWNYGKSYTHPLGSFLLREEARACKWRAGLIENSAVLKIYPD